MAEPVIREENAESVMPSPQDDDEGAVESGADGDEERAPFRMIYNKFLSKYLRWVNGEVAELVGRELLRKRVSFALWGKSYEQKKCWPVLSGMRKVVSSRSKLGFWNIGGEHKTVTLSTFFCGANRLV